MDFGRFFVCYSLHHVAPKIVAKPFFIMFSSLNPILALVYSTITQTAISTLERAFKSLIFLLSLLSKILTDLMMNFAKKDFFLVEIWPVLQMRNDISKCCYIFLIINNCFAAELLLKTNYCKLVKKVKIIVNYCFSINVNQLSKSESFFTPLTKWQH